MAVAGRAASSSHALASPILGSPGAIFSPLSASPTFCWLAERECQIFGKVARGAVNLSRPCLAGVDLECFFDTLSEISLIWVELLQILL